MVYSGWAAEARQRYSSPCQNEQRTTVGCNFCIYMTYVVRTSTQLAYSYECKKSHFFSVFLLDVYPGLGISEIRHLFFRGPIWMRLKNRGSFCVGQVPGTSHVATRPKKHTSERRIFPSLSRPFAAGPASSLFVVVQSVLDVIPIQFSPPIFCSFCRLVLQNKNTRYWRK